MKCQYVNICLGKYVNDNHIEPYVNEPWVYNALFTEVYCNEIDCSILKGAIKELEYNKNKDNKK